MFEYRIIVWEQALEKCYRHIKMYLIGKNQEKQYTDLEKENWRSKEPLLRTFLALFRCR